MNEMGPQNIVLVEVEKQESKKAQGSRSFASELKPEEERKTILFSTHERDLGFKIKRGPCTTGLQWEAVISGSSRRWEGGVRIGPNNREVEAWTTLGTAARKRRKLPLGELPAGKGRALRRGREKRKPPPFTLALLRGRPSANLPGLGKIRLVFSILFLIKPFFRTRGWYP